MSRLNAIRWSHNDRYFGPFTYAADCSYRPFSVVLGSGRGEDCDWHEAGQSTCFLRFSALRRTLIIALPQFIQPSRNWVDTSHYGWTNNPRGGYWNIDPREYGFCVLDGHLSVSFGRITDDSSTEQRWGWFFPWKAWRHVRRSLYDLSGSHFATIPERARHNKVGDAAWRNHWAVETALEEACPTASFEFDDYDGERIVATTRIEEREWKKGEGRFKWLALFWPRKIQRSLDLRFSSEVGKRKGSWKGGTVGHSIAMLPGELHEAAFRRYCEQNNLIFVAND